jgi:transcriptional regulator with XRE-family HTH domain
MKDNPLTDWAAIRLALVARRKTLGLSQQAVADHCRVSRITINRRETGESTPNAFELAVWCRVLGLRLETSLLHPEGSNT